MARLVHLVLVAVAAALATDQTLSANIAEVVSVLPCHRLSRSIVPTAYELELKFPSLDSETYEGHVNISLKFKGMREMLREDNLEPDDCRQKLSTSEILLHADASLELLDIRLATENHLRALLGRKKLRMRPIERVQRDPQKQLIAIGVSLGFLSGSAGKLSIAFRGRMRADQRGVYVSSYSDGQGHTYRHIVSQFQPTDARTVFPVFDEPQLKAPFKVALVHPADLVAFANMDTVAHTAKSSTADGLARTEFQETPPMSAHMLAFTVGQYEREPLEEQVTSALDASKHFRVRLITAPGQRARAQFALEVAVRSVNEFERYINYSYMLPKFDIVAIADHDKDNTESWGLAFVRDTLVWIDADTKPDSRISTAVNVAHVVVHQWFANLVTAAWWTDLWFTEGVASQMAFKLVRDLYPEFQSEYFVRLATLSGVMQADARGQLHAISPPASQLETSDQIYGIFDTLAFMKSGSLAQLTARVYYDEYQYQRTLRDIVLNYAYDSFDYRDFRHMFGTETEKQRYIQQIVASFKSLRGVPLINVLVDDDDDDTRMIYNSLELMHEAAPEPRPKTPPQSQQIDLVYERRLYRYDLNLRSAKKLFLSSSRTNETYGSYSELPSWWFKHFDRAPQCVKVSPDPDLDTYYRVRYSDKLYRRFKQPIEEGIIHPMDRLQILDDANALVQMQLIKNDTFKELVGYYSQETSGPVLIELLVALKTLSGLETSDKSPSPATAAFMRLFKNYGFTVTGRESFSMQRARQLVLKALITQNVRPVIDAALDNFNQHHCNVALFLREPVYLAVATHGTDEQVAKLVDRLAASESYEEKLRLVAALTQSSDKSVLVQVKQWLATSGLKEAVMRPYLEAIDQKL